MTMSDIKRCFIFFLPIVAALLLAVLLACRPPGEHVGRFSYVGNFIPPAHGIGELCSISEIDGVFSIKVLDQNEPGNSSIWNNATDKGLLVLSVGSNDMLKELTENYRIGDIIAVEYPMTPDIVSNAGQITCLDIAHASSDGRHRNG